MVPRKGITVYVDVVCDLFHAGHVAFFRKALLQADHLIVGLLSDANVATYKPPPIMTLEERCEVVQACRHVDRIIADAPLFCTAAFLDEIGADFACHGDDLSPEEQSYWYKDVMAVGRLRVIPYTGGISSRGIVERVLSRRGKA